MTAINRWRRVERWVYHGLHSLDLPYLYNSRPSWDIVMIVLCLGGLTSSGIGFGLGLRRMRRATKGFVAAPAPLRDYRDRRLPERHLLSGRLDHRDLAVVAAGRQLAAAGC